MKLTKEQMERTVALNEMMYAEDPNAYKTMQDLVVISVLARRLGYDAMAENAEELFKKESGKFIKPVQ